MLEKGEGARIYCEDRKCAEKLSLFLASIDVSKEYNPPEYYVKLSEKEYNIITGIIHKCLHPDVLREQQKPVELVAYRQHRERGTEWKESIIPAKEKDKFKNPAKKS